MGGIRTADRIHLESKFANRVTFDPTERRLYGHDIAAMPSLIKPLMGSTIPDAIVQPTTEQELADLLLWAYEREIPVTPRGKATSGYGGVIPLKKGLVVDFYRLNKVIAVDKDALTATVQPGISWEKLDRHLQTLGLTLRLYPTSYPSSSVGGWLAQGGAGIGSYEAGWFRENVVSARVVTPDGKVKLMSGPELDLISDAEGTTGLVSEVTIRVMHNSPLRIVSLAAKDAAACQSVLTAIADAKLPVWSLSFINPTMAALKNKAPLMEHNGHPIEHRVLLPEKYVVTLAYREQDAPAVERAIPNVLQAAGCGCEQVSDEIAQHEWQQRFKLMIVKRLGPSLVPAEMVVPLSNLAAFLDDVVKKVGQPVVKEGVLIRNGANGQPEVVILGFIPSDQRTLGYTFVFGLVLSVMKLAEKHGGRAYSTGMYFAAKGASILGGERARRMSSYKKQIDPRQLLNPGKVYRNGLLGKALSVASVFEPLVRPFGNVVTTNVGEKIGAPKKGIPGDVVWYAYACSQCGYCVDECDQFYGRGWESQSPRGKWYWLREYLEGREKWSQRMVDTFLVCTTCELCNLRCSASLPIEPSWMKLRGKMIHEDKRMTFPPFEIMAAATHKEGDIWAGYRKDRSKWFPRDLQAKHGPNHRAKTAYFAGCTASYVENDIGMASVRLLDEAGVDFAYAGEAESCCGTPMLVAGKWDTFAEVMKHNIDAIKALGADTVVSSCPACDMMWRNVYPEWCKKLGIDYGITAKHYTEVIADKIRAGEYAFPASTGKAATVTWHDSCHIGRASGVYDAPREVIKALPNVNFVEMPYNREAAHCCGSVLSLIKEPPVAAELGKTRLDEALEVGAEKILALCPCCQFQLRVSADKKQVPIEVVDLARYACSKLGYDFPDPNPEVKAQWAVFEAMIALMTPQGFAKLLDTMWPEMIGAMPFGMGGMMRVMGKIPGALNLMKPMFPLLFPRLLPMMMPKLMPTMLQRVGAMIPMPDYMAEQMPDLMPGVMDNLLPHMVGDLVPLVTQPMIDYLQGSRGKAEYQEA